MTLRPKPQASVAGRRDRHSDHEETSPMKKLRLDLDNLKVDSFATTPDAERLRGTVHGQDTEYAYCTGYFTCVGQGDCHSYEATCLGNDTCEGLGCGDTNSLRCGGADTTACSYWNQETCNFGTCGCASWAACASENTYDCGTCNTTTPGYWDSCTNWGCTGCNEVC
jgi:hypothetical protein